MKKSKLIGYILTAICVIVCGSLIVEVGIAHKQQRPPRFFGYSVSYVPTNSMEPIIMSGDYILFYKTTFEDVEVNDIIIYRCESGIMEGNFIVHTVVEKYDDYLITKGENNTIPDAERVTPDMVLGEYIDTVGFLSGQSRTLMFGFMVFVFVIMIGFQFASIVIKYKHEKFLEEEKIKKEKMLEELKKQILEEELEKIRNSNNLK